MRVQVSMSSNDDARKIARSFFLPPNRRAVVDLRFHALGRYEYL